MDINGANTHHHFCQIIFGDTMKTGKLDIPSSFVKRHETGLQKMTAVILKDPLGTTWRIELLKGDDGEIWFANGWQDFAKYYSVDYGHFLTFRYEGNGLFHVIIFDKSASEIDYPVYRSLIAMNASVFKKKGKSKLKTKARANRVDEEHLNSKAAIKAANRYISKSNYPSFTLAIRSADNSLRAGRQTINSNFTNKHFNGYHEDLKLKVGGQSWPVKLKCYRHIRISILSAGWTKFAMDNRLGRGSVCAFELIESHVLQVTIFNANSAKIES